MLPRLLQQQHLWSYVHVEVVVKKKREETLQSVTKFDIWKNVKRINVSGQAKICSFFSYCSRGSLQKKLHIWQFSKFFFLTLGLEEARRASIATLDFAINVIKLRATTGKKKSKLSQFFFQQHREREREKKS